MEEIELFVPLIPGLVAHDQVSLFWEDVMILVRQALPLLKQADKSKLLSSALVLLSEGNNGIVVLDALHSLGQILIILAKDPVYLPKVMTFITSVAKATAGK